MTHNKRFTFGWLCPCGHDRAKKLVNKDLPNLAPEEMLDPQEICEYCGTSKDNWTFHKIREEWGSSVTKAGFCSIGREGHNWYRYYDDETGKLLREDLVPMEYSTCTVSG